MASFAKIGLNSRVIEVVSVVNEVLKDSSGIEREELGIQFLNELYGWPIWKQTSYNTKAGSHYLSDNSNLSNTQEKAFRKNHAGIGYTYDEDRDAFIPKKPYNSWILNEQTCNWESPIPMPSDASIDKRYQWNEQIQNWELING
jgi:hypothetical protein